MHFFLLLLYMCLSDFCLLLGHPLLKKEPCVAVKLLLSAVGTHEGQLVPSCFVTIFFVFLPCVVIPFCTPQKENLA